jgi:hypothetical protein
MTAKLHDPRFNFLAVESVAIAAGRFILGGLAA